MYHFSGLIKIQSCFQSKGISFSFLSLPTRRLCEKSSTGSTGTSHWTKMTFDLALNKEVKEIPPVIAPTPNNSFLRARVTFLS